MKRAYYTIGVLAVSALLSAVSSVGVMAQTADAKTTAKTAQPLFITPYKPNVATYESGMPAVVKGRGTNRQTATSRTYTQPNRKSGPILHDATNQFRSDVGRITSEKSFYDEQTDRTYKQYDYMGLLASRGDTATLRQVLADVQSNGVFDPAKYQAAVTGTGGGTGNNVQAGGGSMPQTGADGARRSYVMKAGDSELPQKLHRGYDEEEQAQAVQRKPGVKQPIFLHR